MYYLKRGDITLLGISGQKSNGKSELAKIAVREFGFSPMSLARHFKVDTVVDEGLPPEEVFGPDKSPRTRDILQQYGTERDRNQRGEDIHIRRLDAHLYDLVEHGAEYAVISDVRFPNEVRWIQSLGGIVYRVYGRKPEVTEGHYSELALNGWGALDPEGGPGFDRMFRNDQTLQSLKERVRSSIGGDFNLRALRRAA